MNRDYPKMTYEQLVESHFQWRESAKRNFNAYQYEKERADDLQARNDEMLKVLERIKADIDEFRSYIDIDACETVEDQAKAFNEVLKAERERADRSEIGLLQLQESIAWIKTKYEFEWTYEPGIGEVVYDIINVLENGTGVLEGKE